MDEGTAEVMEKPSEEPEEPIAGEQQPQVCV